MHSDEIVKSAILGSSDGGITFKTTVEDVTGLLNSGTVMNNSIGINHSEKALSILFSEPCLQSVARCPYRWHREAFDYQYRLGSVKLRLRRISSIGV